MGETVYLPDDRNRQRKSFTALRRAFDNCIELESALMSRGVPVIEIRRKKVPVREGGHLLGNLTIEELLDYKNHLLTL